MKKLRLATINKLKKDICGRFGVTYDGYGNILDIYMSFEEIETFAANCGIDIPIDDEPHDIFYIRD